MKMRKKVLALVLSLTVAFTMCFGCMGEVFALGEDETTSVEEPIVEEGDAGEPAEVIEEEPAKESESPVEGAEMKVAATSDEDVALKVTTGNSIKKAVDVIKNNNSETPEKLFFYYGQQKLVLKIGASQFTSFDAVKEAIEAYYTNSKAALGNDAPTAFRFVKYVEKTKNSDAYYEIEAEVSGLPCRSYEVKFAAGLPVGDTKITDEEKEFYFDVVKAFEVTYKNPYTEEEDLSVVMSLRKATGEGINKMGQQELFYVDNEVEHVLKNEEVDYTAMNNQGNADALYDACGPTIQSVLATVGLNNDEKLRNKTIKFVSNDGKSVEIDSNTLFQTRYAFPASRANYVQDDGETPDMPDNGQAIKSKEKKFKIEVDPILDLENKKTNCFGQITPSDRNKPGFNKYITEGGEIIVTDGGVSSCEATSGIGTLETIEGYSFKNGEYKSTTFNVVNKFDAETSEISYGTELGFVGSASGSDIYIDDNKGGYVPSGKKDNSSKDVIYYTYTTDGTVPDDPTQEDAIYNWNAKQSIFAPLKADTIGTLIIKTKVFSSGSKVPASEPQTYTYKVIPKDIKGSKVNLTASATFTGSAIKPAVSIEGLKGGTDYTVEYANNTKVGKATVTVTGKGNYKGAITSSFNIIPAKANISLSTKKKTITVKVTNNTGASKYTVQYKKKGAKKWTTKSFTGNTYKIKKLKKKKYYYVQVLANGSAGYSAQKKIKCK